MKPTLTLTFDSKDILEYFEQVWLERMDGTHRTKDGWTISKELDGCEDYLANKEAGW
jgi:hypothetical protein